jgi:hypothetical protein
MEFVVVHFRESRTVYIDDGEYGLTDETLRINRGRHTFSLGGPADFDPPEQTIDIANTTEIHPQEVPFA